jgi:shikimate 5-dehydrogenase
MGWIGLNCSLPHKQTVIKHLDELGKSASLIRAVNCVVRRGDRLIGENTDGQGFLTSLRTVAKPQGTRVTILGAGGAARAIRKFHVVQLQYIRQCNDCSTISSFQAVADEVASLMQNLHSCVMYPAGSLASAVCD